MLRLLFSGLAAVGVFVAITLWWRPQESDVPELVRVPPLEVEPAAAANATKPPASRAPEPAAAADPKPVPAAQPAERSPAVATSEASRPGPPALGEPALEEEPPLVLVERPDFEDGPPGALEAQPRLKPEAPAAPAPAGDAPPAPAGVAPPPRVDVDRSGELIRRMLALYDAMRG